MPDSFDYSQAEGPLLLSFPHDGTEIPEDLAGKYNGHGNSVPDTDWFIYDLYDFIHGMNISWIKPRYSRYVVDLNRSPEGVQLYPGKFETSVCPVMTFNNAPIYEQGSEPTTQDIESRISTYWRPYHKHVEQELMRIKSTHGYAILWDAHSIMAEVPGLFSGILPDLNFGTADNTSCATKISNSLVKLARDHGNYSVVLNGRFKGGYIIRLYGNPSENIHALQLEINQDTYLDRGHPPLVNTNKSMQLKKLLQSLLTELLNIKL